MDRPQTRYARSDDVNIAYQVVGDGPRDLVFVMGWVSHLDYFWEEPSFARFLNRLASFSRLILFDKRGTGLSDRVSIRDLPTLEQRMDDVRAVMDAVGSQQAALLGVSEGGPLCALFAATYPERTTAVVMYGGYARRSWDVDHPWAPTPAQLERFLERIRQEWGTALDLEDRAPTIAGDQRFRSWWATYLSRSASPGAAVALTRMNADIDIRHILGTIRVTAPSALKVPGTWPSAFLVPGMLSCEATITSPGWAIRMASSIKSRNSSPASGAVQSRTTFWRP